MGLGGYLTWTALSREIHSRHGLKIIPMEVHGSVSKLIKSEAFHNNPTIVQKFDGISDRNFGWGAKPTPKADINPMHAS